MTHVGMPPSKWEECGCHLVHFHDFEGLPSERDRAVCSPVFKCCNREWKLRLYPGGDEESDEGMVSLYLVNCSGSKVHAWYALCIRSTDGRVLKEKQAGHDEFEEGGYWGWGRFMERSRITDLKPDKRALIQGTLSIEVSIRVHEGRYKRFVPRNPFAHNMLRAFMDKKSADVIFEVGCNESSSTSVQFPAHRLVLQFCAKDSTLASLCEDSDGSTPVQITNIDAIVFHHLLYYIYGGKIDRDVWKEHSRELIDAADWIGLNDLKIEAEAWYVEHHKITLENAVGELLYADEKNCFLLRERASSFLLNNMEDVIKSKSIENVLDSKSAMMELFSLVAMNNQRQADNLTNPESLSVNELRAKLYGEGKDYDGSRKALIARLAEASAI